MRSGSRTRLAATVGALLVLGTACLGEPPPDLGSPTRLIVIGDSITQGRAGDYTWRYRLWQRLEGSGVPVDMVGPVDDLHRGSEAYADRRFDRAHAARWGARIGSFPYDAQQLGSTYLPDVAVILLGVNDLSHGRSPTEVEASMRDMVEALRRGSPGVDVVVSHIPNADRSGVAELNQLYDELAGELDTEDERVVVASAEQEYLPVAGVRGGDTYDGLHPSESGERKIAHAVADALFTLGLGESA